MLSLSIQNCLRSRIGSRGIAPTELKKYRAKLEAARKSLEGQRKSGRLGFFELPYNEEEAGRMEAAAREWKGRYDNFVVIGIGGSAVRSRIWALSSSAFCSSSRASSLRSSSRLTFMK